MSAKRTVTCSDVVAETGVPPATLRFYVRKGLLPKPRSIGPRRHGYDRRHIDGVRLIRLLRADRGLSLDEIRRVLPGLLKRGASGFDPPAWEEELRRHGTRRDRLLKEAFRIFARRGHAASSIEEIAAASGVAKGTIYRSFSSKEALFLAAITAACRDGTISAETARKHLAPLLDLAAGAARREPGFPEAFSEIFSDRALARAFPAAIADGVKRARARA